MPPHLIFLPLSSFLLIRLYYSLLDISSFITKYSKKEGKDLINDFQKLLELFSNNDIMSKKLSGKISHSFYLLSIISYALK